MSFAADLKKFTSAVEKNHNTVVKDVAFRMSKKIIKSTPVQDGFAKRNWHVELNSQRRFTRDETDKTGDSTIAEARAEIAKAQIGDSIYLTNNLPYIERLEDGHSEQAPVGMVKVAVAEFKRTVDSAARQIINKSLKEVI